MKESQKKAQRKYNGKLKAITIRLYPEEYDELKKIADENNMSFRELFLNFARGTKKEP